MRYRNLWQGNSFLRRQATASMSRFGCNRTSNRLDLLNHQAMSGVPAAVSIANQLSQFSEISALPFRLNAYLFPAAKPNIYPHSKFIVLCSVLASKTCRTDHAIINKVDKYVSDPWHREILRNEFKMNFP